MKNFLRAVVVMSVTVALGACAKATGPKVTCGTGTHDDGAGTCQLDNALALNNIVGSNYWGCWHPNINGYDFYLSLGSNGSGVVSYRFLASPPPTDVAISWQEGAATDEITVSTNPWFDTIMQIVPSAAVGAQTFTGKAYKSGVLVYNLNCQLKLGTF